MIDRRRNDVPRIRSLLTLCGLMLFVIFGGSYLTYRHNATAIRQSAEKRLTREVLDAKTGVEHAIASLLSDMESWALQPVMVSILDDDIDHEIAQLLDVIIEQDDFLREVSCITASGEVLATTSTSQTGKSVDGIAQLRERFEDGIRCEIVEADNEAIVTVPVFWQFDERELIGLLRARVAYRAFLLHEPDWWEGLATVSGRVIAQRGATLSERISLASSDETYPGFGRVIRKTASVEHPTWVIAPAWLAVAAQQHDTLYGQLKALRSVALGTSIGSALVAVVLIMGFTRRQRSLVEHLAERSETLQAEVAGHKRTMETLGKSMTDLERFNRLAVGRERRMIELKQEVNEMAGKAGVEPPFDLSFTGSDDEGADDPGKPSCAETQGPGRRSTGGQSVVGQSRRSQEGSKMPPQNRVTWIVAGIALTAAVGGMWWSYPRVPARAEARAISAAPDLSDDPIYKDYEFGQDESVIDLGAQPMWIPTGLISETMRRDTLLHTALAEKGLRIRFHSFLKGADVNFFMRRGDLEVGIGGDMPALTAAADSKVLVAALIQQGYCSIVAARPMLVEQLRGRRIGYAFGSNAHYALLAALSSAGLGPGDVRLVPLDVTVMPDALFSGAIDAFSAWEPTPTIALNLSDGPEIIHRRLSPGFLYFARAFADRHPEVVRQIVASELRAIRWMQSRNSNLAQATRWAMQAEQEFTAQPSVLSVEQYMALAKNDVLGIPDCLPAIPQSDLATDGHLSREFEFLQRLGGIPRTVKWEEVQACFDRTVVEHVLTRTQEYRLTVHEYAERGDRP